MGIPHLRLLNISTYGMNIDNNQVGDIGFVYLISNLSEIMFLYLSYKAFEFSTKQYYTCSKMTYAPYAKYDQNIQLINV
jgi:hypothetical protein